MSKRIEEPLPEAALMAIRQVCARTSLGRTLIYQLVKAGKFPAPIKIGRASRWRIADVEQWIAKLGS